MSKLEKIEQAIAELRPEDVQALADWLAEYQADLWDRQIEQDSKSGLLDKLVETALAEHRAGLSTEM
jgi:flagellar motor switch protein FliG